MVCKLLYKISKIINNVFYKYFKFRIPFPEGIFLLKLKVKAGLNLGAGLHELRLANIDNKPPQLQTTDTVPLIGGKEETSQKT